jgi:hypothetical protein
MADATVPAFVELPPDLQLVALPRAAAALDIPPRRLPSILAQHGIALVQFGERGQAVRLSDLRRLIEAHQRRPQRAKRRPLSAHHQETAA